MTEFFCGPCGLELAGDPRAYLLDRGAAAVVIAEKARYCAKCGDELPFGQPFVVRVPPSWLEP